MDHNVERELILPNLSVRLATVNWDPVGEISPELPDYCLCQRLSGSSAPLRIENRSAHDALPRVRSVGFLPPGCAVRLFPVEQPFRLLSCSFEKTYFEHTTGITERQWHDHTGSLVSIRNQRLEILMQEIYAELEHPDFGHEFLIGAAGSLMLVELARYARQLEKKSARSGKPSVLAPWQLRRIQERIESSLDQGYPNLSELSDLCGISQGHLMRTFKASTGWQIQKYIAMERFRVAKRMLADQQFTCKEIAARLGYRSPAYFTSSFRRMAGKTPTEYRRQAQAGALGGTVAPA